MSFWIGNVLVETREDWGARDPRFIVFDDAEYGDTQHYEGVDLGDYSHFSCPSKVRGIQNYHMDARGWSDIAYNWMACNHGIIFECRGLGVKTAANGTVQGNDLARAICGMWGPNDTPSDLAKHAVRTLNDYLTFIGDSGSGRNCHFDWKATQCPGSICNWVRAGLPDPLPNNPNLPPPVGRRHARMNFDIMPGTDRIDFVSVGTDHHVWHYVTVTGDWSDEWREDLGGRAKTASCKWNNSGEFIVMAHGTDDNKAWTKKYMDGPGWTPWFAAPVNIALLP